MSSVEDYYRDLAMEIAILPVNESTLPRTAQLTQKTNQFNVTTFRYTEAEVGKRMRTPEWILATTSVGDRFGDNGIVGVTMARQTGPILEIDTLLLSCRVIGRAVETAMLAHLCEEGRRRGATTIEARFIPTAKNDPARDVFERHGFVKVDEDAAGTGRWRLDIESSSVAWPEWFKRVS
jgi:FkbH-like protein